MSKFQQGNVKFDSGKKIIFGDNTEQSSAGATPTELTSVSGALQTAIDGKADTVHTHVEADITDLDKYTQAEVDAVISTTSGVLSTALTTHTSSADHDGRYYTESEVDALTWTESDITDLDKYTQAEVDTISGALNTTIQTHISDTNNPHSVDETDILPSQTTVSGYHLSTNGTNTVWVPAITPISNYVTVAKSGGQYTTIQAAIDSVTDASADNTYAIKVYPGEYEENITLKNYVSLVGEPLRRTTKITATSGTLLTLPDTEAHCFWIDFTLNATTDNDLIIDATAGAGATGFYRIENSDFITSFSADIKPKNIDANVGVGLYLINTTLAYTATNTATTGTYTPVRLQAGNNLFYFLRSIIRSTIASQTANVQNVQDNSTGRILSEICTNQITITHATYSGIASAYAFYGGVGTVTNTKQINNTNVVGVGNGAGTCYAIYYDSTTNDGALDMSRNVYNITGFATNGRYYVGTGDSIYTYFNRHLTTLTDIKIGDIKGADIHANDAFVVTEKIGLGTDDPLSQLHIQSSNSTVSLEHSGDGDRWDIVSNGGGIFRIYNYDTSVSGIVIDNAGNLNLTNGVAINEFSSDDTLSGDSDAAVPTEQAVKAYVDNHNWTEADITDLDKYTQAEVDSLVSTTSGILAAEINNNTSLISTTSGIIVAQIPTDFYTQAEVDTISGSLSSEIDSDISTHSASGDHDGRYYTETELDNGQLDNRYYTETEVDTISGSLNTTISTHISDTANPHSVDETDILPSQTTYSGSYLTTNGSSSSWTDTLVVGDHSTVSGVYEVVNVMYGTSSAPTISGTTIPIGTLYFQYTA